MKVLLKEYENLPSCIRYPLYPDSFVIIEEEMISGRFTAVIMLNCKNSIILNDRKIRFIDLVKQFGEFVEQSVGNIVRK